MIWNPYSVGERKAVPKFYRIPECPFSLGETRVYKDVDYDGFDWGGASFQEKRSAGTSGLALGMAVVMVFLILAAQYEKWSLPLSVMMALPFDTFGALAAVWLRGMTNDVYFQIGLVTLLGLAAKYAILIVEYAIIKHSEGLSYSASALEAARLRLRPILMTSLAFRRG